MFGTIKMILLQRSRLFMFITIFFIAIAWLSALIELFLPHTGVHYVANEQFVNRPLYRISQLFYQSSSSIKGAQKQQSTQQSYATLRSWTLQALYEEKSGGFAIVLVGGKTHFINVGEAFQGYTFEKIEDKTAYFIRSGQRYKLTLNMVSRSFTSDVVNAYSTVDRGNVKHVTIKREEINRRIADPKLIWSEIRISPYMSGGIFKGYVLRSVKKGSIFERMGLKRSDLILSANGEALDSNEKVINLYKNIDKIEALVLGIQRDDQVEEISFEIK